MALRGEARSACPSVIGYRDNPFRLLKKACASHAAHALPVILMGDKTSSFSPSHASQEGSKAVR